MAPRTKATKSAAAATVMVGLAAIAKATEEGSPGYIFTQPAEHNDLVAQGLVEVNAGLNDGKGGLATRATGKGIEQAKAQASAAPPVTNTAPPAWGGGASAPPAGASDAGASDEGGSGEESTGKPSFEIETGVAVPKVTNRGRTGESIYPFDKLQVGQSFFVPKEAKNLASTISGANARYSEVLTNEDGTPKFRKNKKNEDVPATRQLRKFIVRSSEKNGVKGSRIWRVEVKDEAPAQA